MSRDSSGYCGHYSSLSSVSLEPSSVPSCIFRNPFRYNVDDCKPCGTSKGGTGTAHEQSLRYADAGRGEYIPNEMLQRTILEDARAKQCNDFTPSSSSLVGVRFSETSYLVHTSGKNFDTLTLKETNDLSKSGFNLKVGGGMPLVQVQFVSAGTSLANQSFLLSRSAYEVFQARMIRSEELGTQLQKHCGSSALLEPVQKWRMPCVVADMSTSGAGSCCRASVLCANGQLFQWNASSGMKSLSSGRSILPQLSHDSINSSVSLRSLRVECSMFPQVDYLVFNSQLLLYDAREPGRANSLFTSGEGLSSAVIDSVRQFPQDSHRLLVSCGGNAMVLDTRHARSPLQKRPLPFAQTMVRSVDHRLWSKDSAELFLGANEAGSQILSHCIESSSPSSGAVEGQSLGLLTAASVFGLSSSYRWDSTAFPVITAGAAAAAPLSGFSASNSCTLSGFDVVPCSSSSGGEDGLLLVHQNSLGDVYGQRVRWGSNQAVHQLNRRGSATQRGRTALHSRNTAAAALGGGARTAVPPSSVDTSLDLKSLIGSFGISSSNIKSSSSGVTSSSSSSAAVQLRPPLPSPAAVLSSPSEVVLPSSIRISPIQLSLPCGVRASTDNHTSDTSYPRTSSSFALHQQQARLLSFDVLTFDPAHVRLDYLQLHTTNRRRGAAAEGGGGDLEVDEVEEVLSSGERGAGGLEELVERVTQHPLTLLEVWRIVNRGGGDERVSLSSLRRYLTSSSAALYADIAEVLVPLPILRGLEGVYHSCYQNAMRSREGFSAQRGTPEEVCCGEVGCPMAFLYCYRRRHYIDRGSGGGGSSSSNSFVGGNKSRKTLGCIYKPNHLVGTAAVAVVEEDLFLTQQSQPLFSQPSLMSPLAAAIGGSQVVASSQSSSIFTHQSILNTQNSVAKDPSKKKHAVTSDLINSLSDSWDSLTL